jgi:cytochrome c-type biogenesis protein CcmH/NrfF
VWLWAIPGAVVVIGAVWVSVVARRVGAEASRVRESIGRCEEINVAAREMRTESEALSRRFRELGRR